MVEIFDNSSGIRAASSELGGSIEDIDEARFMADVIKASLSMPVVVLFYKKGSEACHKLEAALSKLAGNAKDMCRLFRMNIDANRNLAIQLRLQSVPSVFAFHKGQVADGFAGVLPEDVLRKFLEKLCGGSLMTAADRAAEFIATGDSMIESGVREEALRAFSKALEVDPGNVVALSRLVKMHIEMGDLDEAAALLSGLEQEDAAHADISSARAALDLARRGSGDAGAVADLEQKIADNGNDHTSRFALALALNGMGRRADAVEHLMFIIARDRAWNEGAAHSQLLEFFTAWGFNDQASIEGRRRLSRVLFS